MYDKEYARSISNREQYWTEQANELVWTKKFTSVIKQEDEYIYNWFEDGEMNICYNAVDRHVDEGNGDRTCFIYDSVYTGVQQQYTYKEV